MLLYTLEDENIEKHWRKGKGEERETATCCFSLQIEVSSQFVKPF